MVIHEVEQEVTIHLDIPMEIVMRILQIPFERLLFGLGIRYVGETVIFSITKRQIQ